MAKVTVDPVTRIEGHLKFETNIENGVVVDAKCSAEMYRGIEKALIGYDARVAGEVSQRICGFCPYSQTEAAALALEDAMGIKPNHNGQLLRNLIVGAYQVSDYLLHFYIASALDFLDIEAILNYDSNDESMIKLKNWVKSELNSNKVFPASPFLPRYQAVYAQSNEYNFTVIKNYLDSMKMISDMGKMIAIFGAKAPHPVAIEAGGCTTMPTVDRILKYQKYLDNAKDFVHNKYVPDIIATCKEFKEYFSIGGGYTNYLSYPYFPDENGENPLFVGGYTTNYEYEPLDMNNVLEDHKYSYYKNYPDSDIKPMQFSNLDPLNYDEFLQEHHKDDGKYSWAKAPRYKGDVVEVGTVARVINTYLSGKNPKLNKLVDKLNQELNITIKDYNSVMGRHLCRAISTSIIVDRLQEDIDKIIPNESGFVEAEVPKNAFGIGLTEATRGALAHWIATDENGLISNYEMIVPTTWNISPRDAQNRLGAVEKMLVGTKVKDEKNPIELTRIVRSTDPCLGCSVH